MLRCPHCGKPVPDRLVVAEAGRIGGTKVARERGPEFYRKLQAMRKHRGGGRPRKHREVND
jgi:hypothetical protein